MSGHKKWSEVRAKVINTPEREAAVAAARVRAEHEMSHDQRCCSEHGTHSMPHVGCVLR